MSEGLKRPISATAAEAIAARLRVLGQPLRVRLLDMLETEGELSVGALAERLDENVQNVSQHLSILRTAGVVRRRQHGREALYSLSTPTAVRIYERVAGSIREETDRLGEALDR